MIPNVKYLRTNNLSDYSEQIRTCVLKNAWKKTILKLSNYSHEKIWIKAKNSSKINKSIKVHCKILQIN